MRKHRLHYEKDCVWKVKVFHYLLGGTLLIVSKQGVLTFYQDKKGFMKNLSCCLNFEFSISRNCDIDVPGL